MFILVDSYVYVWFVVVCDCFCAFLMLLRCLMCVFFCGVVVVMLLFVCCSFVVLVLVLCRYGVVMLFFCVDMMLFC